jgi:hypothetical protein
MNEEIQIVEEVARSTLGKFGSEEFARSLISEEFLMTKKAYQLIKSEPLGEDLSKLLADNAWNLYDGK